MLSRIAPSTAKIPVFNSKPSRIVEIGTSGRMLQHLPIGSLKGFGTNPHSEPIWRVVWSESRHYLVGALHTDYDSAGYSNDDVVKVKGKDPNVTRRQAGYRWMPLYPSLRAWVLEQWRSPAGFTGCTPEQYVRKYADPATGLCTLGPYPDRGEYVHSFTFPSEPTISTVTGVINRIRAGWNYSYAEHKAANDREAESKKKAADSRARDIMLSAQQAFRNRPSNISPGKRTADKIRFAHKRPNINPRGFSTGGKRIICQGQ